MLKFIVCIVLIVVITILYDLLFIYWLLTINFNLAQITVRKLWVIARINNLRPALVVKNDVTCMKWTLNSLVLWWRAYSILYFMETTMTVVLRSCIWNIQGKPCHPRCEWRWSYSKIKINKLRFIEYA